MPKSNEAARDLWSQIFASRAKADHATLLDPKTDRAEEEAKFTRGLRDAGWSDEHIRQAIERQKSIEGSAPITSPGVNPFVEAHLARLCDDVEAAMDRLKFDSHAKVARGVEPRAWAYAAKVNVVLTDQSIITVSAFLFRFCGLIARAFTRTLLLDPHCWDEKRFDQRFIVRHLLEEREILLYWMRIYLSFAVTGTHALVPFKPARPHELLLFEQIARAMELFVIAHEYGHHHHGHGKQLDAAPHAEEFEADQFALCTCYEVERYPLIFINPYLSSGAGGVIMLTALETLRQIEDFIGVKRTGTVDTHPKTAIRIARFNSVAVLKPAEFDNLNSFRTASGRVMRVVNSLLLPALKALPSDTFREINKFEIPRD
jgi:hypothetical protein